MSWKPEYVVLLRNNDIPSESTIREVKESLKAPLIELKEIEVDIQRLCELVETMKIKRKTIQKRIDDYNIILSPVRRLPLDVLHEIFFHCLPTHRNPIMSSSEPPVLLTRVCSSWRAIALSSPRIWSKIHIPLPGDPSCIPGFGITTLETTLNRRCLARSTDCGSGRHFPSLPRIIVSRRFWCPQDDNHRIQCYQGPSLDKAFVSTDYFRAL